MHCLLLTHNSCSDVHTAQSVLHLAMEGKLLAVTIPQTPASLYPSGSIVPDCRHATEHT